jgi:hypothetical protein
MFRAWHFICLVVGVGFIAIGVIASIPQKQQNTQCDIPDSIIYPETATGVVTYSCPDKAQKLEVHREENYKTYIRCSCK